MILFHASDLIWATKIKATAEAAGVAARPVRSVEMLEARLADSPVRAIVVDLDALDTALALIRRATTVKPPIPILAFGPHIATDAMSAAREAGAGTVVARGGFEARMSGILKGLDDDPAGGTSRSDLGRL